MRRRDLLPLPLTALLARAEQYVYTPDSSRQPNVPRGTVTAHTLATSKVYPGTTHEYWVYVPAQYNAATPAAVMFFQDGRTFVNEAGAFRVPVVFDNLIHKGEMPVTIAILINPGTLPPLAADQQPRFHRSHEYDAVTPLYARFLIEDMLPLVGQSYNLTRDPNLRAISGSSSGGNCSVNAAWERPDAFRRVLSFIAGFTHQRGALILPSQVRKFEGKPLRIFLQDGTGDVNIQSNQDMIAALEQGGYDAKLVVGSEGHNSKHGGPLLPEALRWVWRDWKTPIAKPLKSFASRFVDQAKEWQPVAGGNRGPSSLAVDGSGNVYFADAAKGCLSRIDHASGAVTVFRAGATATSVMFGPDGRLYAAQPARRRIVAYDAQGRETVVAAGVAAQHLAVAPTGAIYCTEPGGRRVWRVDPRGGKQVVHEGMVEPAGVRLSPDHSLLQVADAGTRWVWSFQIQPGGGLAHGIPFHRLEVEDEVAGGETRTGAGEFTVDSEGFLYVATRLGLQVSDPAGRTAAVLLKPEGKALGSAVFGGTGLDTLYVSAGDGIYRRPAKRTGVWPWKAVKPPVPRL
jgi:enterochelin esterase-like enzyme/sugar lactone lactonase YvrE